MGRQVKNQSNVIRRKRNQVSFIILYKTAEYQIQYLRRTSRKQRLREVLYLHANPSLSTKATNSNFKMQKLEKYYFADPFLWKWLKAKIQSITKFGEEIGGAWIPLKLEEMWVGVADIIQLKDWEGRRESGQKEEHVCWLSYARAGGKRVSFKVDKSRYKNLNILDYIKVNTKENNTD